MSASIYYRQNPAVLYIKSVQVSYVATKISSFVCSTLAQALHLVQRTPGHRVRKNKASDSKKDDEVESHFFEAQFSHSIT